MVERKSLDSKLYKQALSETTFKHSRGKEVFGHFVPDWGSMELSYPCFSKERMVKACLNPQWLSVYFIEVIYNAGICDECGETPPSLQWMYPDGPPAGQSSSRTAGSRSSWGPGIRRPLWLRSMRSSSSDRPVSIPHASQSAARRLGSFSLQLVAL